MRCAAIRNLSAVEEARNVMVFEVLSLYLLYHNKNTNTDT